MSTSPLPIPSDKLPTEWKDESRLDSLYSPFRSRTVNPRDYDSKITSWKHMIYLYCLNNGVYSVSLGLLKRLFVRHGRPPSCLDVVFEELVKSGVIQPLEDFLKEAPQSWSGWAADLLVKRPISWSYNKLRCSLFTTTVNPESMFVHVEVIKVEAQKLIAGFPDKSKNKVINFSDFLILTNRDLNQADDVKLLLSYLAHDQVISLAHLQNDRVNSSESLLIKVGQTKASPITEVEIGVYVLELNEKLFTKQVEELEDEVAACIKVVKAHLLKGHKKLAKTCLMKKHEVEKRLTRKINALHNIQVLLEQIRDVHTDADVWNSYKYALSTFNTTFKETGLTEDAVEDTMLKLGEMLEMHEDIQATMAKPVKEDETDLEEELAELLKVDETAEDQKTDEDDIDEQLAKLDLNNLPEVPSQDVSVQEVSLK